MRLYGFCINDIEPFNSTRYYAHIEEDQAEVMWYTKDGYEHFCSITYKKDLDDKSKCDIIRQMTREFHTKLENLPE